MLDYMQQEWAKCYTYWTQFHTRCCFYNKKIIYTLNVCYKIVNIYKLIKDNMLPIFMSMTRNLIQYLHRSTAI